MLHALSLCVNGHYQNVSTLWIDVPPPFYRHNWGFLGVRITYGRVTDC